ncbi:hypothetical protein BAUCODRAFT_222973 [Baudoinia panamericana UAMH 10762]|uniref:Uncharacterized protein n=1 Tax=Baudoinia panamericana (strain UAMH 10762) TaxID=717646 RepID=M2N572_BAUPA|nr:uncharacterized protein BAUCODRAFT_222973 [Baudoinia panamericana UAMH 10762]EMC94184.1 hypothetical protein BAUCODRAFT_222973 [Baudoinia panamericana UAMH 10762]
MVVHPDRRLERGANGQLDNHVKQSSTRMLRCGPTHLGFNNCSEPKWSTSLPHTTEKVEDVKARHNIMCQLAVHLRILRKYKSCTTLNSIRVVIGQLLLALIMVDERLFFRKEDRSAHSYCVALVSTLWRLLTHSSALLLVFASLSSCEQQLVFCHCLDDWTTENRWTNFPSDRPARVVCFTRAGLRTIAS